jgi:hypothetical protein
MVDWFGVVNIVISPNGDSIGCQELGILIVVVLVGKYSGNSKNDRCVFLQRGLLSVYAGFRSLQSPLSHQVL